jgi:NAD(P)-dependent dehydrogenase (short-subunit alcohol dehydrogenase family)
MDLRGMVALVTGGNGGLGQRICHALAREGVEIAVVYAQSREPAESVARDLAARHQIKAAAFACDVTDGTAVEALIGQVTGYFGRIDILVNDAAYNKAIPFADLDTLTFEIWDKIMDVNLTGPLRLIKAVAPLMKAQRRGRIVNRLGGGARADRFVDRLCRLESGPHPAHALHGGGTRPGDAGQLRSAGIARRHARHGQSPARAGRARRRGRAPAQGRRQG